MMAPMGDPGTPARQRASFIETQRFRQPLLLLLLAAIAAPFWYLVVAHFVVGAEVEAAGDLVGFWLFAGVLLPGLLLAARLTTEVSARGLRLRFPPFVNRRIPFADIRGVQARTYRPLREFGGWGIRWAGRERMAYNVSGNRGVEVELTDGRTVMVGSQRPDELADALRAHMGR
jgi:Family of unknown function (DUF6141)